MPDLLINLCINPQYKIHLFITAVTDVLFCRNLKYRILSASQVKC